MARVRLGSLVTLIKAETVIGAMRDAFGEFGFETFSYRPGLGCGDVRRTVAYSNFPNEWIQRYRDKDYAAFDSILIYPKRCVRPLTWKHISSVPQLSRPQRNLFNEICDFGFKSGGVIPIHGPRSGYTVFSLASTLQDPQFQELWDQTWPHLYAAAASIHEKSQALADDAVHGEDACPLSPREKECLLWASEGKTAWETAKILGLRQDTVTTYLKSATRKLGAVTKTQAVVKAVMQGLIAP